MSTTWAVVAGLAPSIGLGIVVWVAFRAVIRADRNERAAQAKLDAHDAASAGEPK